MAAYVIYQGVVTDPEQYERYKARAAPSVEAAGGRYLVRGGTVEVMEGDAPAGRIVVLEFPTMQAAVDWYHGAGYTDARALREGAAQAQMFIVDGMEPPA